MKLSTSFPRKTTHYLKEAPYDAEGLLRYHQHLVQAYVKRLPSGSKGVLIDHMMGEGKTRSSISVAEWVRATEPSWRIVVITNKSLAANYRKQLVGYVRASLRVSGEAAESMVDKNYRFVSMNASNMFEKLLEKNLAEILHQEPDLEDTIIIMDEAQNFFNAVTNGSKNALALYDRLMRTRRYIFIPMSGTPMSKDVFAIVPCLNLLAGFPYLPENRQKFYEMFVDEEKGLPKNAAHLMNFMMGKVSYFGPLIFPAEKQQRADFPRELPDVVEEVHMSDYQYSVYHSARSEEKKEGARKFGKPQMGRFQSSGMASTTYRVRSRQASNFVFPADLLREVDEHTAMLPREQQNKTRSILREGLPARLSREDLEVSGLEKYSPKLLRLLRNIEKHKGQPGVIYSSFVTGPGLAVIARALDQHGYKNKYGFVTGAVDPEEREKSIRDYNSGNLELLLISGAGAEGLNLKGTRHLHVFEPYWHYARISQVKARASRYKSHSHLPADEQTVQSYIYLSILPRGVKQKQGKEKESAEGIAGEETTDESLWNMALKNRKLISEFELLLARASVDCGANVARLGSSFECRDCLPTDVPLYTRDVEKDVNRPSACEEPKDSAREEVEACEIEFRGRKLWYTLDERSKRVEIFEFDKVLNEYVELDASDADLRNVIGEILRLAKKSGEKKK